MGKVGAPARRVSILGQESRMPTSGAEALGLAATSPSALESDLLKNEVLAAGTTEGNRPLQTWHSEGPS